MARMRLKEGGSLNNRMMEAAVNGMPAPEVGMGVTLTSYTDRHAGTVTKVVNDKTVEITEDKVEWLPWPSGYAKPGGYSPNPAGKVHVARKRKDGTWRSGTLGVVFGFRDAYSDPHF